MKKSSINFKLIKKIILTIFILNLLFSCQEKTNKIAVKSPEKEVLKSSDLYDKVFIISSQLNAEKCLAYSDGCDCCEGRIVFLKSGVFISNFYCIPDEEYNTGTFEIKNSKLNLNYSKNEAVFGPENEEMTDEVNILKLETIGGGIEFLDIIPCGKKIVFKSKDGNFYSEDLKTSLHSAINNYKKIGVWKLLEIKE
jgi:hypothetical protein